MGYVATVEQHPEKLVVGDLSALNTVKACGDPELSVAMGPFRSGLALRWTGALSVA